MVHRFCFVVACLMVLIANGGAAFSQADIATEAPNWCNYAKQYLRGRDGSAFVCAKAGRCIKMNNYGCTQNHSSVPAPGQMKTADGKPIHDAQKHVLYEHPKWSLHKSMHNLLRYYDLHKRSLLTIAETWAPWCDTIGSKVQNGNWGRTCVDHLPSVPASFGGPRCKKSPAPTKQQCAHCNCPNVIASFYSKGVSDSVNDDLQLFDNNRRPTPLMNKLLPRMFIFETGYVASDELVSDAIASFQP
jgi:hypothetical protein